MNQRYRRERYGSLTELREHARGLARDLTGQLRRVRIKSGDATIEVEWQPLPGSAADGPDPPAADALQSARPLPSAVSITIEPAAASATDQPPDEMAIRQQMVCSPMVGTYYRAVSPDAAPFVEVGDIVVVGQTVAIIEAMKLFNPIVAELAGVVAEVLVQDGQSVEFGQPLLRLTADSLAEDEPEMRR